MCYVPVSDRPYSYTRYALTVAVSRTLSRCIYVLQVAVYTYCSCHTTAINGMIRSLSKQNTLWRNDSKHLASRSKARVIQLQEKKVRQYHTHAMSRAP